MRFKHNFPADGEYRINIDDLSLGLYTSTVENESTLVIMIDGKIVFRKPIGGPADLALADRKAADGRAAIMDRFSKIPVQVQAGVHDVVVTFIDRAHVESDENVAAGFNGIGVLGFGDGNNRMARLANGIEIIGPFNSTGVSQDRQPRSDFCLRSPEQKPSASRPAPGRLPKTWRDARSVGR